MQDYGKFHRWRTSLLDGVTGAVVKFRTQQSGYSLNLQAAQGMLKNTVSCIVPVSWNRQTSADRVWNKPCAGVQIEGIVALAAV